MKEKDRSQTAIVTATMRAAHYLLDPEPRILDDSFARAFAGFATDEDLLKALNDFAYPDFPRMRTLFAVRNRFAEDELAHAVERGISQYIILGAGLDSFAYRRSDLLQTVDVYEIDHPASQRWKRQRVHELGVRIPARLHYVPIDFERQTLTEGLTEGGVNLRAPSFLSWLGVTQYLSADVVLGTLCEIAGLTANGSQIAFQFVVPPATLTGEERSLVLDLAAHAAQVGEPWLSFFEPVEMESRLRQMGYANIVQFGAQQATERYLLSRTDGLRLPAYFHMISASVG
jgi:methyltransferase (TIGR00027 family)